MSNTKTTAEEIVEKLGGPGNITELTHCATRLRATLADASKVDAKGLQSIKGVMGAVPQGADRYQVIIGGAVSSVYKDIMALPSMAGGARAKLSDADVKAAARAKARGKNAMIDSFFEYLSDSFRPLLGALLGASLIIAIAAVLDALGVIDFRSENKGATWFFWDAMWRAVFYFLPVMVAYNAAKKLGVDPWLGFTVMAAMMTPEFMGLKDHPATNCVENANLGTETCSVDIFGIPMTLNDYSGQVFVPLLMVPFLAIVYHQLRRIVPENVQMVFVPFISMLVMIPVTAFIIGPFGVFLGNGLGAGLAWLNGNAPILFAVLIPLLYPFLVPLGLHWPLNALMLQNISVLGYDFIQGPMGAWNFACFGATAGVLVLSMRQKDYQLRQVSTGALAAGIFGGISEPSLYGIHLRYKKIYPRLLLGCLVGGVIIGLGGGVNTNVFAFTSLLTVPVFDPIGLYLIAITAAFFTAMFAVIIFGFRTPEETAQALADQQLEHEALEAEKAHGLTEMEPHEALVASEVVAAAGTTAVISKAKTDVIVAPVTGQLVAIEEVNDPAFSSKALGEGVGIIPESSDIVAPVSGTVVSALPHAVGIATDDGVEVLVHVGIDTVNLQGQHFNPMVKQGQRVEAGDMVNTVDFEAVKAAGYDTTTLLVVTNTLLLESVTPHAPGAVRAGDAVINVKA